MPRSIAAAWPARPSNSSAVQLDTSCRVTTVHASGAPYIVPQTARGATHARRAMPRRARAWSVDRVREAARPRGRTRGEIDSGRQPFKNCLKLDLYLEPASLGR